MKKQLGAFLVMGVLISRSGGEESLRKAAEAKFGSVPYAVCVESSLRKVFRDPSRFAGELAGGARVSLAGNEHEGFQVLVMPLWGDVRGVHVEFEDLICRTNGSTLDADNLTFLKVDYVKTRPPPLNNTTYKRGRFPVGFWPDPLLPEPVLDVPQEDGLQPLWIDVYAPAGTPAGVYTGKLTVNSWDLGSVRVPIEVEVWDFSLPVQHHLKTAFSFSLSSLYQYYMGRGNFDDRTRIPGPVLRRVCDFLLEHRVSPTNIYNPHYRQQFPRRADLAYCVARGLDAFNIGRLVQGRWDSEQGRAYRAYLTGYLHFLEEKGWKELAYVYGPDEIQYRRNYAELKERYKEGVEELRSVAADLEVMAAVDIDPDLHGWVDLWCPLPERWDEELGRKYAREGEKSWFYWCIGGQRPALLIDFPAIDPRMMAWVCWKYEVEGFLYYWINMWRGRDPGDERPLYPDAPWEFSTPLKSGNGSGLLIYPGRVMGEVFSSIRFENVRDGLEDYEYLARLRQLGGELERAGREAELVRETRELLAIEPIVQGPAEFEQDPRILMDYRAGVARQIEKIQEALRPE